MPTKLLAPLGCPAPLVRDGAGRCVPRGLSGPPKGDLRPGLASVPPVIRVPPKVIPPVKEPVKPSVVVKPQIKRTATVKEPQKPRVRETSGPTKKSSGRPTNVKTKQAVPHKKDGDRSKQP